MELAEEPERPLAREFRVALVFGNVVDRVVLDRKASRFGAAEIEVSGRGMMACLLGRARFGSATACASLPRRLRGKR
ncbi:hypothetical protein [Burkholderia contaminans]|uniref:hypothetical protein n=1 Tax=Burkholderia contaminans TaxID=488447 RepID=UPI000F57B49F|nr:hypothetical protein [Burkholderia contaminans]RQS93651.1 hypothetical protein DF035_30575 [Burkholderia contaminans]